MPPNARTSSLPDSPTKSSNSPNIAGVLTNVGVSTALGAAMGHYVGKWGYKNPLNVAGQAWRWGMASVFGLIAAYASLKDFSAPEVESMPLPRGTSPEIPALPTDGTPPATSIQAPAAEHAPLASLNIAPIR